MTEMRKIPVGLDDFEKLRRENFYYVDKSGFIKALVNNWGEVNLFTRPRRFGKTLNMSILKSFFEIGSDKSLFDGLEISQDSGFCEQYQGKFPVIFISLKSVAGDDYNMAYDMLGEVIREEALRFQWLLDSDRLTQYDKAPLEKLLESGFEKQVDLHRSLKVLSRLLHKHYEKKAIVLIDEYDVPLEKAYEKGYYDKMVTLVRAMFEMVLKSNQNLHFAVVTGCLRISKESIFTGLNNFSIHSIEDTIYDEYFGFTDQEVRQILFDYHLPEKYKEVKEWYDGYRFGQEHVYCPWDVLNYVKDHTADPDLAPAAYWVNSSSNAIVKSLLYRATATVKDQIETLMEGGTIEFPLVQELTYQDLDTADESQRMGYLWSVLYTTGYLTDAGERVGRSHRLRIPNKEIREIFELQIENWFSEIIRSDKTRLSAFCDAVKNGDAEGVQRYFNQYLSASISIRDTSVRKEMKENFYHGILLGLLSSEGLWIVKSNAESGLGYSDILVEIPSERIGCVIEVKYAEKGAFDVVCKEAMEQIFYMDYTEKLRADGMEAIQAYGIGCYQKSCKVVCGKIQ